MFATFSSLYQFFFQAIIISLITFLLVGIEWFIYHKFHPRLERTRNLWDDILLQALHIPLQTIIILIGISFIFDLQPLAGKIAGSPIKTQHFRECVVAINIVWFLLRYIKFFEKKLIQHAYAVQIDRGTVMSICKLLRVAVAFLACLFILQIAGIPISGLLAFGGAGAIVAGLAAKDLLANYFGGLMIYTDRPFSVGDWVRSPDHDFEGTVERIGWRLTRIRRFDSTPMYVPNALFSSVALENPSRMKNRRIKVSIGLRYEDFARIPAIIQAVEEMLSGYSDVDQSQKFYFRFNEYGASSLNLQLSVYLKSIDTAVFMTKQQEILLTIGQIIKQFGADFAFNTLVLQFPEKVKIDFPEK